MAVKTGPEVMITDEISNDSIAQLSPCDSFTSMRCQTSTAKVMRSFRSNPMIGGPGILPSPPFPWDDSNPPDLLTMSDTEASSDSGIDESCTPKKTLINDINSIPNSAAEKLYPKFSIINGDSVKSGDLLISNIDQCTINTATMQIQDTPPISPPQLPTNSLRNHNRKTSISYMDSGNPLMTSFFMDLCNNQYNMNESYYLEGNDLVQVLHELTNDMALPENKA